MHSYYWFIARSLRDEIVELVFFLILSGPVLFNISFLLFFFSLSFSRTNFLVRSVSISFYFFSFSPRLAFLSIFLTDRSRKKWKGKKMNREMGEIKRKNAKKDSVLFFTSLSIIYNIPCKEINFYEYRLQRIYTTRTLIRTRKTSCSFFPCSSRCCRTPDRNKRCFWKYADSMT